VDDKGNDFFQEGTQPIFRIGSKPPTA